VTRAAFDPLAFVAAHGVVLVSGKGGAPRLSDAVAGEPVRGSWWAHPAGKRIFDALQRVAGSPDIVVCKLAGGRQTLVHRRAWPVLWRLRDTLPAERSARVIQEHAAAGHHRTHTIPIDDWMPGEARAAGDALDPAAARAQLDAWLNGPA
jgi:hypothetical protein